jgi:RNA polymerase sigma-70 factor, ECF subfamily
MRDLSADHNKARRVFSSGDAAKAATKDAADSTIHVLERARNGDVSAARVLMERALPSVKRWARGRLPGYARGSADTEDVVQDAFLRTFKNLKRFRHHTVGALHAYLRRSVLNRIRDLIRGSKHHAVDIDTVAEPADWNPSPLESVILRERVDVFLAALAKLRPVDRQVVVWRLELGFTPQEIANRLGKSEAAAAMTVSRAMARLAKELRGPVT